MQDAQFEEKDFEGALYHQLASGSPNLWTPGQVFEHHFGIDAALQTAHAFFLAAVGRSAFPGGLSLSDFSWGYVWRSYGKKRGMPSFEANALLQAKRPQHLEGKYRKLVGHGIAGEYWRFEVVDYQQRLLVRLHRKVMARAVVAYACPAFHMWDDLEECLDAGNLPDRCSYVTASSMLGHKHWCFTGPGGIGVAASEPERITSAAFAETTAAMSASMDLTTSTAATAGDALAIVASSILATVAEEVEEKNGLARAIDRQYQQIPRLADELGRQYLQFLQILTFAMLTSRYWFVVGRQQE